MEIQKKLLFQVPVTKIFAYQTKIKNNDRIQNSEKFKKPEILQSLIYYVNKVSWSMLTTMQH